MRMTTYQGNRVMTHDQDRIEKTFRAYSDSFKLLKASALVPFYSYPALLVDRDGSQKVLTNPVLALFGLSLAISSLKRVGYVESRLTRLEVQQLSDELAVVSGAAQRLRQAGEVFDQFNFQYTMRQIKGDWKIVAGFLYPIQG